MSGSIDAEAIAIATEMDPGTVSRALSEAARAGLVEDRDQRLVFRHALLREAVAADLVSVEAQELHRRLAAAVEAVHAADLGPHAKALAHHWYQGRDRVRAMRYALEAGDRALALAATHEARQSYELAAACSDLPSPQALMGLAEVEVREGRTGESEMLFRRAAEQFLESGRIADGVLALGRLSWVHAVERRFDESFAALDQALALVDGDRHPAERAALLAQKGRMFRGGRPQERHDALQEAALLAGRLDDHATRADALEGLAWEAYRDHRADEAVALSEQSCEASLRAGRAEAIGRCHNNCALIHSGCGDPQQGIRHLTVARELLERSFGSLGVQFIDTTEALMRFRMGQPNHVARLSARLEVGWSHSRGTVRMLQAWCSVHAGEMQRARAVLSRAREEIGESPSSTEPVRLHAGSVEVLFGEMLVGLEDGASALVGAARDLLAFDWSHAIDDDEALAVSLAANALLQQGERESAVAAIERLEELVAGFRAPHFIAAAAELRGRVALAEGDSAAACQRFREAADRFAAYPNAVDRARCLRHLAWAAGDEAKDLRIETLKEARTIALEAGSQLEAARSEVALRKLGVRPRAGRPRKGSSDGPLSSREEEIAALVGAGATNGDIAARLFLSERTVQDHVTHALRKLSLSGRAGLAAWAAKRGLV